VFSEVIDVERTADFEQPAQSTEKPILTFSLPADEPFYFGRIYVVCDVSFHLSTFKA